MGTIESINRENVKIIDAIENCIAETLKKERQAIQELAKDEPMNVIGLNSLNFIDCIMNLEKVFNIAFDDEELLLDNLNTINKLSVIIEKKLKELN